MHLRWSEAARSGRLVLPVHLPRCGLCLLLTIWTQCSTRVEALRAAKGASQRPKEGVRFLKIQKTGSSSLNEIIKALCPHDQICRSDSHIDWVQATSNGTFQGPVVTLLRDPVERALSEFFYLRDADGISSSTQAQWDFRNPRWLERIRDEDIPRALRAFTTGYDRNPSRNRQALYILGFRGRADHREPGAVYDWDKAPGELVRRAMRKLENLTAFGITDCWEASMRAIGGALHWDPERVRELASSRHERNWRKAMVDKRKPDYRLLKAWLGREIPDDTPWSQVIPREYVNAIKAWSHVDMELYSKAKKRFSEKFGEQC